jgi:malonyl CoA-acyl carrier protein transacylase
LVGSVDISEINWVIGCVRLLDESDDLRLCQTNDRCQAIATECSVLSHLPLLLPVADALTQALQNIQLHSPRMVYVSNVKARVLRTAVEVASDLANKIAHGVRWYDATTVLQELGCNLFVEMPPGHVLTNLAKRAIPRLDALPWQRILSLILCDKRNSSDERAYHPG